MSIANDIAGRRRERCLGTAVQKVFTLKEGEEFEMKQSRRSYLAIFLMALLVVTLLPPGAMAAGGKPSVTLEQAIGIVKANLEIPKDYPNFTSSYQQFDSRQTWSLNWQAAGEPGGSFNAQVDADTGEILNVNQWQPDSQTEPGMQLSPAAARQAATRLLNQLAGDHLPALQPVPDDNQLLPISRSGAPTYTFRWQRVEKGIPFPGNGVTVMIRSKDGQLASYTLNWTKAEIPGAAGAISPEKAREAFTNAGMLKLQYFLPPRLAPFMASGEKQQVMLVYKLQAPANGAIDALSGEPFKPESGYWISGPAGGPEDRMSGMGMADLTVKAPLSPQETKEIAMTVNLISQDEAVAAVKKWVDIPQGLTPGSVNLMADWQSPDIRIWNLNWQADKPGVESSGRPQYLSARVNAVTGELLGFDLAYPPTGTVNDGNLDRAAAQEMAEDFLQKVQPQRFSEVRLDESSRPAVYPLKGEQSPPSQQFNYIRLVNGIDFPESNISVMVDASAKRITHYSLNWPNLDFPAPGGAMDIQQAADTFLQSRPLALNYVQVYGPGGPGEVRLVYLPLASPGLPAASQLDAKTGELLDWQGKALTRQPRPYHFNDIAGESAEKEISLLGQAGVFGEYGDSFHPGENVTAASLLRAMLQVNNGIQVTPDLTDQEVLKQAKARGWLKEDLQPGAAVSREALAKITIRMLNLEPAARAEGIYQVPFTDAASLNSGSLGYVALAWGLGIIKDNEPSFNPDRPVTRSEAAKALVRAMEIK